MIRGTAIFGAANHTGRPMRVRDEQGRTGMASPRGGNASKQGLRAWWKKTCGVRGARSCQQIGEGDGLEGDGRTPPWTERTGPGSGNAIITNACMDCARPLLSGAREVDSVSQAGSWDGVVSCTSKKVELMTRGVLTVAILRAYEVRREDERVSVGA